jgi:hypothetical protein
MVIQAVSTAVAFALQSYMKIPGFSMKHDFVAAG